MSEWMITLDTPHGVTHNEEQLLAFSDAIDAVRETTGAATSMNSETGALSATFTIEADEVQEAVDSAVTMFNSALRHVGLPDGNIAHLDADPLEDREAVPA